MILAAAGQSDLGLKRSRVISFLEGGLGAHKREAIGRVLLKRIVLSLGANNKEVGELVHHELLD